MDRLEEWLLTSNVGSGFLSLLPAFSLPIAPQQFGQGIERVSMAKFGTWLPTRVMDALNYRGYRLTYDESDLAKKDSFRTYCYRMLKKPQKKPTIPPLHPEGGFWTEGEKLMASWAVRSRFDPRSADPPHVTVGDAELCQEARLDRRHRSQRRRFWRDNPPFARKADRNGKAARD